MRFNPPIAWIALTAVQLTSDIVWLEQEMVTLPDGTTTQALVPHVYLKVKSDAIPEWIGHLYWCR